jgi:hypothetical protein
MAQPALVLVHPNAGQRGAEQRCAVAAAKGDLVNAVPRRSTASAICRQFPPPNGAN